MFSCARRAVVAASRLAAEALAESPDLIVKQVSQALREI